MWTCRPPCMSKSQASALQDANSWRVSVVPRVCLGLLRTECATRACPLFSFSRSFAAALSEGFFVRFACDTTVVLLARRLQLNMFPLPDVSRTTPEDDLLKTRPCHVPCREEMSKMCVLGITRGRDYHTHRSDTRHFAFPLITDTSSSLATIIMNLCCPQHLRT